jgi:D-alanyl-D-alanine carboxypeptidase
MQAEARQEGILLVPLSGFRSLAQQEKLFFGVKAQRGQRTTERAEVSAPPGYSEHHTGYAIDIGDGKAPTTHVEERFAETEAFAWLEENAARYNFELSFPKDNQQISYEPWHWRYVGNQESLEIFYKK